MPRPMLGKRAPVVLPGYLSPVVDLDAEGWPTCLLLTPGFGLLDPAAGYWHGQVVANDGLFNPGSRPGG